jgi:beta-lactamase regulating signal transducer with metallopeptidase domain
LPVAPIKIPEQRAPVSAPPAQQSSILVSVTELSPSKIPPSTSPVLPKQNVPWPLMIWAAGTCIMAGFLVFRSVRAARLVHRATDITLHPRIQRALIEMKYSSRRLKIRETGELLSPALCGIWRPAILLPLDWSDQMSDAELRCIISHELGHFHRGDLWWKWAFQLTKAIHWFNPLVWFAERMARADQEMACDEWVLSREQTSDVSQYGEILLKVTRRLGRAPVTSPIHAGMAETKAGLARRVKQLARFRPHGWRKIAAATALATMLALSFGPAHIRAEASPAPSAPTRPAPASSPATAATGPKYHQVEISAKFISLPPEMARDLLKSQSILTGDDFQKLIRNLNQRNDVDLISTPSVTTKSDQRATIQIVRELRYPTEYEAPSAKTSPTTPTAFETKPVGITLEAEPHIAENGDIVCVLSPRIVKFLGFVNYAGGYPARTDSAQDALSEVLRTPTRTTQAINQPIFETRSTSVSVILKSGQTVVLGDMGAGTIKNILAQMDSKSLQDVVSSDNGKDEKNSLYAFITARLIDDNDPLIAGRIVSEQTPPPKSNGIEYATTTPGKPGFAISPYAPKAGYVDLRGFPRGTEVKCPYTGKMFLVP